MMDLDVIYNEDCLSGMQRIPDKSVDLIICDLPYGTTANNWDYILPLDTLWEQYNRIAKENAAVLLFGQRKFSAGLVMSNVKSFRYDIVYEKPNAQGFFAAKRMPLRAHEDILVFYRKLPTYNPQFTEGKCYMRKRPGACLNYRKNVRTPTVNTGFRYPRDVVRFSRDRKTYHPTQKPVALLEYLIRTYSNENDIVLDNCIGGGYNGNCLS